MASYDYSRKFAGKGARRGKTSFFNMGSRVGSKGLTANKINLNFAGNTMVVTVDDKAIAKTVENWEQSQMLYKMALGQGANKALLKTKNYIRGHRAIVGGPYEKMAVKVANSLNIKPALGGLKFTLLSDGNKKGLMSKNSGFMQASALQTGTGKYFGAGSNYTYQKIPWAKFFKNKGRGSDSKDAKKGSHGSGIPLPAGGKGSSVNQILRIYEGLKVMDETGGYLVVPELAFLDYFGLEVAEEAGYRIKAMTKAIMAGQYGNVKQAYNHFKREESLMRHVFRKDAIKMGLDDKQRNISSYQRSRRPKTADMSFKQSLKKRY